MCEHKNLRTVGDRLFCKDCKQELPLEFLLNQCKPEEPAAEEPAEVTAAEIIAAVNGEEPEQEAPQGEQETGVNAPVSEEPANDTPKKKPAKTGRKTAKKGE